MKDVCNHCIGQPWRHGATGYSLRFCKGCKNFHHIHAFERADDEKKQKEDFDPLTTAKGAKARSKGYETRGTKKKKAKQEPAGAGAKKAKKT